MTGNDGNNTLTGNNVYNYLVGKNGSDSLLGGGGYDKLSGGDDNDTITGGAGEDTLIGGLGADRFIFNRTTETPYISNAFDKITDFSHDQGDKIDLSNIDADISTKEVNDAFLNLSLDTSPKGYLTGLAELYFDPTTHYLYGNTDVDGKPDFIIKLLGVTNLLDSDLIM